MNGIGGIGGSGANEYIPNTTPAARETNEEEAPREPDVTVEKSKEWREAERVNDLNIPVEDMIEMITNDHMQSILVALNPAVAAEIERRRKAETGEDKKS